MSSVTPSMGLFSKVHYPTFAATSVPRDFVEYPSQVYSY